MRASKILFMSVVILGLIFTFAFAAGEAEKGKALFNDAKFAGGVKACGSCHPNGKGLEKAGETRKNLEEMVNNCLVQANKGKAIDVKSEQMKALVAYIKSLKAKKPSSGY